jgi:two-component system alkaline phosphatase synthesis response regulator PhoP
MPTILVVDDEPTIRLLVRAALEGTGYRLIEASDGLSALQVALSERPDVVLLDIALPRLSGLEVCRRLKENPATASAPVLLLTGLVQESERQAAEEVGARAFIAKPFSPAALVSHVEDALLRRPAAVSR